MLNRPFDRSEHVYRNDSFDELVKDAVRFFNGTPAHILPPPGRFAGAGVYALYYTGSHPIYHPYSQLNRLAYNYPIYVGKAVPRGWRQARISLGITSPGAELFSRIREHSRNIFSTSDLSLNDFACRFVIFEDTGIDMISTIEAALIKLNRPLWNTVVDGFGNHTPGNGRFNQAKSDWDVLHPGRSWADLCLGTPKEKDIILSRIEQFFDRLK